MADYHDLDSMQAENLNQQDYLVVVSMIVDLNSEYQPRHKGHIIV